MVPTYGFVTYRLSGSLDRLRKLRVDMLQHCKWIAYGADGLGGKGCTRMHAPEVVPARFWARFPSHWCHGHGIARHIWRAVLYHIDLFESS